MTCLDSTKLCMHNHFEESNTPFDFQGQRSKLGETSCMIQILSIIFYKQFLYIYIYIYNIVLNASAGTLILRFISNTVTVVICVFAET